jgi:tetratricopeptide (TPR) repeat protein
VVPSELSLKPGSIADIAGRLTLWARRNPQGLVRVEYSSEFARQVTIQRLQTQLTRDAIVVTEMMLPFNRTGDEVVADLLQQLEPVAEATPHSLVSITGFATAFRHQESWPEALRVVNFNHERFAALPLRQIWWFTPAIMQTAIHAMPDLNSWFSQRLQLLEAILPEDSTTIALNVDTPIANINDARQRAQNLMAQFHQAKQTGATDADLLKTYLLPALEALAEASAQRELRELAGEFEGWLGSLKLEDSPDLAQSLDRLASIYTKQGRYREALPFYRKALQIREQQLGTDHPDVATSLNNLALLYQAQGRYGEAEPFYLRSLQIDEQQLGAEHPDVATSLNNLALLYQAQGRYGEAEPLYIRAIEIGIKTLPAEHPKIAFRQDNFAGMVRDAVAAGQAEQLSDHPATQAMLQQLRNE